MKLIPKIIIWLTKFNEGKIATVKGNKPKSIYCHRNDKNEVIGLLFKNTDEPWYDLLLEKKVKNERNTRI